MEIDEIILVDEQNKRLTDLKRSDISLFFFLCTANLRSLPHRHSNATVSFEVSIRCAREFQTPAYKSLVSMAKFYKQTEKNKSLLLM